MSGMDTLLSMKVFRQIVESRSFVGAAERLNLSTAMTSKHLMFLEKHLGSRLLNRSSRRLSLTESGKLYFERCKVILEELEEAELAVGSVSGVPRGTLRVTAPSWFVTRRMVDVIAAYRQLYPEVVVDISFEDRLVDLIEEGYDLALRATGDEPPAGLIARPLRLMPFVIDRQWTVLAPGRAERRHRSPGARGAPLRINDGGGCARRLCRHWSRLAAACLKSARSQMCCAPFSLSIRSDTHIYMRSTLVASTCRSSCALSWIT
jgi:DNA-binding transcriptional LysR family regulator